MEADTFPMNIQSFPTEIIVHILSFADDTATVAAFARVSRGCHAVATIHLYKSLDFTTHVWGPRSNGIALMNRDWRVGRKSLWMSVVREIFIGGQFDVPDKGGLATVSAVLHQIQENTISKLHIDTSAMYSDRFSGDEFNILATILTRHSRTLSFLTLVVDDVVTINSLQYLLPDQCEVFKSLRLFRVIVVNAEALDDVATALEGLEIRNLKLESRRSGLPFVWIDSILYYQSTMRTLDLVKVTLEYDDFVMALRTASSLRSVRLENVLLSNRLDEDVTLEDDEDGGPLHLEWWQLQSMREFATENEAPHIETLEVYDSISFTARDTGVHGLPFLHAFTRLQTFKAFADTHTFVLNDILAATVKEVHVGRVEKSICLRTPTGKPNQLAEFTKVIQTRCWGSLHTVRINGCDFDETLRFEATRPENIHA